MLRRKSPGSGIPADCSIVCRVEEPNGLRNDRESVMMNEAGWDRAVRFVLGVVLMIVGFGVIGGTGGTVLGIVAIVPLLTGVVGWCPLYTVLGIRTNGRRDHAAH